MTTKVVEKSYPVSWFVFVASFVNNLLKFNFNFPGPHVVEWEARTSSEKTVRSLHRDVERGGVKVDTGMDEKSGYLISRQRFILESKNKKF